MRRVNPDLAAARSRAHFDRELLTHCLDGGIERSLQRRKLLAALEAEPLFNNLLDTLDDRVTGYIKALGRARRLKEMQTSLGIEGDAKAFETLRCLAMIEDPTTLHELMFVPNIEALCTPEQQKEWLPKCRDWRVIGCYAQTEIGAVKLRA